MGDLLADGHDAFRRGDAAAARRAFEHAVGERETGDALEGVAKASHLAGDYRAAMAAYERAYAVYRGEGNALAAARCARTLGWFRGSVVGDWAVYRGWAERARIVLEQSPDDRERGWLLVDEARAGTELEAQQRLYLAAVDVARRYGDRDLECEALVSLGGMLACSGYLAEGVAYMDATLATVCAGEVEELSVIEGTFCGLFTICDRNRDVVRAEQWLRAADDFVRRRNIGAVGGYCRAHYGGILIAAGRWTEAETELQRAIEILSSSELHLRGTAQCRLADLRIGQGRLEDAAALLSGLELHEDAVRPSAGLCLARGEPDLAREIVERALAAGALEDVVEGPLLALLVDVNLAAGDFDTAAEIADRLTELARHQPSEHLKGIAAFARGKVCVHCGDGDARACFHQAIALFARTQSPVDLANTRLELARALVETAPDVAMAEAAAAFDTFDAVGAVRDADRAAAVLRSLDGPARTGPKTGATLTKREHEVVDLLGHGLSNADIGERLFISPKTVEHHVSRILSKLGLKNRSQVAAWAVRVANE